MNRFFICRRKFGPSVLPHLSRPKIPYIRQVSRRLHSRNVSMRLVFDRVGVIIPMRGLSEISSTRLSNTQIKKRIYQERLRKSGGDAYGGRSDRKERDSRLAEPSYGSYDGDHIFGVQPVHLALRAGRRRISELLVQEGLDPRKKKDSDVAQDILDIASANGIPIRYFPKHDLNMLCDNHVHQGFVLRAQPISMEEVTELAPSDSFKCVLALDEVTDPQNLGALLRTAHFLKCDKIVLCAKNSAPLNAVVSKSSAGALELLDIGYVTNLMKFLDASKSNGWKVVGSALTPDAVSLASVQVSNLDSFILVLGNEGRGIRTNILKRCDLIVKLLPFSADNIMGEHLNATISSDDEASSSNLSVNPLNAEICGGVDSLNVSVAGGILLYIFLGLKRH